MFAKGDFIVEQPPARGPVAFGVVRGFEEAVNGEVILDVQFPTERVYAFASQCLHYRDWLHEQRL